jgi:hypothetical protein
MSGAEPQKIELRLRCSLIFQYGILLRRPGGMIRFECLCEDIQHELPFPEGMCLKLFQPFQCSHCGVRVPAKALRQCVQSATVAMREMIGREALKS